MKKNCLMITFALTAMAMLSACSNGTGNKIDPSTGTVIEHTELPNRDETDAEPATEAVESTKPYHENEQITTIGAYQSSSTAEDVNGEYTQMRFTDENGNDFIANISKDTKLPDEMIEGTLHNVVHSDIMTMSEPGIYPQVYSISPIDEEARAVVSSIGTFISSEEMTDSTDGESHYLFTDENGSEFIALITEETQLPESMEEGKSYTINHSGIMTRSLPGIYTEVYSIVENE